MRRDPARPGREVDLGQCVEVRPECADARGLVAPELRLVGNERRNRDGVVGARGLARRRASWRGGASPRRRRAPRGAVARGLACARCGCGCCATNDFARAPPSSPARATAPGAAACRRVRVVRYRGRDAREASERRSPRSRARVTRRPVAAVCDDRVSVARRAGADASPRRGIVSRARSGRARSGSRPRACAARPASTRSGSPRVPSRRCPRRARSPRRRGWDSGRSA